MLPANILSVKLNDTTYLFKWDAAYLLWGKPNYNVAHAHPRDGGVVFYFNGQFHRGTPQEVVQAERLMREAEKKPKIKLRLSILIDGQPVEGDYEDLVAAVEETAEMDARLYRRGRIEVQGDPLRWFVRGLKMRLIADDDIAADLRYRYAFVLKEALDE